MKFTFIFCLIISTTFSQEGGAGGFNFQNELNSAAVTPQSPESAAFEKYGDNQVNLFSGTPQINIPIYTHKGRELNLPFNISYDASGIKMNQKPTFVGLGWNFNVGGRISRRVNGLPDDYKNTEIMGQPYISWYENFVRDKMVLYQNHSFGPNSGGTGAQARYNSKNEAQQYLWFLYYMHIKYYETQPDVYYVNAPGLNEVIVFDVESKDPFCLGNPNIKVEILAGNINNTDSGGVVEFKLIKDDGTQYFFHAVEETYIFNDNDTYRDWNIGNKVTFNSSWYLNTMISPTGKDVYEFEYVEIVDHRSVDPSGGVSEVITSRDIQTNGTVLYDHENMLSNTTTTFHGRSILDKVKHNNKIIVDVSHQNSFSGGPDTALNEIIIYNDGDTNNGTTISKKFSFNYDYFKTAGAGNPSVTYKRNFRLKLDDIKIKDSDNVIVQEYKFEYIGENNIGRLYGSGQDYLGYYNGFDGNPNLIRAVGNSNSYPPSYTTFQGSGANRDPNYSALQNGILNKITYPTGGYSTFEYEQARVNEGGVTKLRSGIRIKNIKDYSAANILAKHKTYQYNMAVELTRPVLEYTTQEIQRDDQGGSGENSFAVLHRMANAVHSDKQHIGYTQVTEVVVDPTNSSNNIEKTYSYDGDQLDGHYAGDNQIPLAGGNYSGNSYGKNHQTGIVVSENTLNSNTTMVLNSDVSHRETWGLALGIYGQNNNLYPILQFNTGFNEWGVVLVPGEPIACIGCGYNDLPVGPPSACSGEPGDTCTPEISRLSLRKTFYSGSQSGGIDQTISIKDNVTNIENYSYTPGDKRYLASVTKNVSNGTTSQTTYSYPHQEGYGSLEIANMLNTPVVVTSSPNGIISSTVQTYYSGILPSHIKVAKGNNNLEERMKFEQYDNENNLLQVRQTKGSPMSFIWGYNNRYIVAKIENINYNDIPNLLVSNIKSASDAGDNALLKTRLDELREHVALSESLMSSYIYKPNIGLAKMIDPTGYVLNYYYDKFQRLERVEDRQGKVLSLNEYNYKN